MKMRWVNLIVVILLAASGAVRAQDAVSDILGRMNALRHTLNLPDYRLNSALMGAAQEQAQWMASTGNVAHQHPDGSTPRTRAAAHGYGSTWVGENIYMGGLATVDSAWDFWMHSPIHYAGLTSPSYQEVGIGSAHSDQNGTSFVIVFGNPGGSAPVQVQAQSPASNKPAKSADAPSQPSYVVGVDSHGNIMHQVQEGDTIGEIALIYGYTWDDIPYMLKLNGMSQDDARHLKVGSIFLVPPKAGTYTPTAESGGQGILPTPTPTAQSAETSAPVATATIPPLPTIALTPVDAPQALAVNSAPTSTIAPSVTATEVAELASPVPVDTVAIPQSTSSGTSPWLMIAIAVQVGIVLLAAVEFIRRARR